MKRRENYFSGKFIIIFLLAAGVAAFADVWQTKKKVQEVAIGELINGQWSALYEKKFNETLCLYKPSIGTWGVLNFALFGEGKEGVVVGRDGWLFTSEEFDFYPEAEFRIREKLDYIEEVNRFLKGRNVRLVIALLPSKARIYEAHLGGHQFPAYNREIYPQFKNMLEGRGIAVADIAGSFERDKSDQRLFLKTDTHWSPYGARIAAYAVMQEARRQFPELSWEKKGFSSYRERTVSHKGDLLRYLPLGILAEVIGPEKDDLPKFRTIETEGEGAMDKSLPEKALFEDEEIPLALVGTSYSANKLWNFAGFMREAAGAEVLNVADEGRGPFITMENYLMDQSFAVNPPRLVVWEIPERYLAVEFEAGRSKKAKGDQA